MTYYLPNGIIPTLDQGYTSDIDQVDEARWYELLDEFDDANIYQTWAYGLVRSGRPNMSHLVVKEGGKVVGIAQSRIMQAPMIRAGVAYVMWGPLWRRKGEAPNIDVLRQVVRALRNEYAVKRQLLVRLSPALFEEHHASILPILEEEGFARRAGKNSRTILMDVTPSIDKLHTRLRAHWQRELKVALKQQLHIIEGVEDHLVEQFIVMYKEMVARKQFREPNDIHEFREIQRRLPQPYKMRVMLCRAAAGLCAGGIVSAIGDTALYLFGATSSAGMKSRGSYLIQWSLIERLKAMQVPRYDLNGINPETNPGTYKFKSDLAGDEGLDLRFMGQFEAYQSLVSLACVTMGEKLRSIRRSVSFGI